MERLSRLIAGTGSSPTKQRPVTTPAERLALVRRICNALQQTWRTANADDATSAYITKLLERLNGVLQEESRKAAPHSCLRHIASQQIYVTIVKLALSTQDTRIIRLSSQLFHILLHGEAEGLFDNRIFARALIDLVYESISKQTIDLDTALEADLVERLFQIANQIKLDPDILPAWFYPDTDGKRKVQVTGDPRKDQFPLFYLLVDYVHHDAPAGDFARIGLLYLTETASQSKPLEQWMIESDLAPQMASGLGALYSRLGRRVPNTLETIPPIILLSDDDYQEKNEAQESAVEFQDNVKAFLSYLAFWQDTLDHCSSPELDDTLLDYFEILFVQQLLYPSLLESSDIAGGSTSTVITHLYRILLAIEHSGLAERILRYLMATSSSGHGAEKRRQRMSMSRRRSINKLAAMVSETAPAPGLFNLLDLIILGLSSRSAQTVTATLKLISVITSKHHVHVLRIPRLEEKEFSLEVVASLPTVELFTTRVTERYAWPLRLLNHELAVIVNLAIAISGADSFDQSYQYLLDDAHAILEYHICSCATYQETKDTGDSQVPVNKEALTLAEDCRVFDGLLALTTTFFGNNVSTNLALTEAIVSLASCRHLQFRDWLLSSAPCHTSVMKIIQNHIEQIRRWRTQFPSWDELLRMRRMDLMAEERATSAPFIGSLGSLSGKSGSSAASTFGSSDASLTPNSRAYQPSSSPTTTRGRTTLKSEAFGSLDSALSTSPQLPQTQSQTPTKSSLTQSTSSSGAQHVSDLSDVASSTTSTILQTRVALPMPSDPQETTKISTSPLIERLKLDDRAVGITPTASERDKSSTVTPSAHIEQARTSVSLSHILTNAVILQEFILEIAAVLQVRVTLFGELELQ